jgi:osmotically-inducible protein OsmY
MFGPRTFGRTLRPQPSPGVSGSVGVLRNQRFVRGNRQRTDFVGADRVDARQFVGLQQSGTAGAVRSAVAGLAAGDTSTAVNQPRRSAPAQRPYDPRLEVGFAFPQSSAETVESRITRQLASRLPGIEVAVLERTAILRGVVASEEDRQLAELLAGFESGVSRVENQLRVVGSRGAPPPPPPPAE